MSCDQSNIREEVRASSYVIVNKTVGSLFLTKVFDGVRPQDITHETLGGWLAEAVDLREGAHKKCSRRSENDSLTLRMSSRVFNSGERPP